MKESFEIKQQTTPGEFYKLTVSLSFKNKKIRRIYFLIVAVGTISSLTELLSPKPSWVQVVAGFMIGALFPLIFFLVGSFVLILLIYMIRPGFFRATYFLNHWGMIRTSAKAEIQLSWSRFLKWKETKDFFLLFIVEHDVHIISKRNLEQQDLPELRTLLSEKIGLF
jgi:hypothetical protein